MKKYLIFALFFLLFLQSYDPEESIVFITWNIQHFGDTKKPEELEIIADIISGSDLTAIQEVKTTDSLGYKTVLKVIKLLNDKGDNWSFSVSKKTHSPNNSSRSYAYLWRTSKVHALSKGKLLEELDQSIDREPYFMTFTDGEKSFGVVNIHTRPINTGRTKSELKALGNVSKIIPAQPTLVVGDFNQNQNAEAFRVLKTYYSPAIIDQETVFGGSCKESDYLSNSYDNIFYSPHLVIHDVAVVNNLEDCSDFKILKGVSDHLPVQITFSLK